MGRNRRFRGLGDAHRYGADFALICRGCGREVMIEQKTFIAMVRAMGLPSDAEALARRFRCTCFHASATSKLEQITAMLMARDNSQQGIKPFR